MAFRSSPTIVCENEHTYSISTEGDVYNFQKLKEEKKEINSQPTGVKSFKRMLSASFNRGNHSPNHKNTNPFFPSKIASLKYITSISGGLHHTLCLDGEGFVFSFGNNMYGQLGFSKEKVISDSMEHNMQFVS